MTIAIGLTCFDGIVLCADRQMTDEQGGMKYEADKIWLARYPDHSVKFVFAYAGLEMDARSLFGHLSDAITEPLGARDALHTTERVIKKGSEHVQTIIAFPVTDSAPFLLKTVKNRAVLGETEYIGGGDSSVVRYLANLLLSEPVSTEQARAIGSYVVWNASLWIDKVDRGPDVVTIQHGGTVIQESRYYSKWILEKFAASEPSVAQAIKQILFA